MMTKHFHKIAASAGIFLLTIFPIFTTPCFSAEDIKLPEIRYEGGVSVEEALAKRRSVRRYSDKPVTIIEISQLLWAAQGITGPHGFRTAPSAGALYPLEIYVVAGNISALSSGIYRYRPHGHSLVKTGKGDQRAELSRAALRQRAILNAPAALVICCVYDRTTIKYGQRGMKYVHMEAGHSAQNVFLQAASLGLGTVVIGAFDDEKIKTVLNAGDNEEPLYIMPVGRLPPVK